MRCRLGLLLLRLLERDGRLTLRRMETIRSIVSRQARMTARHSRATTVSYSP